MERLTNSKAHNGLVGVGCVPLLIHPKSYPWHHVPGLIQGFNRHAPAATIQPSGHICSAFYAANIRQSGQFADALYREWYLTFHSTLESATIL